MRIAVAALARPTFDVEYASELAQSAVEMLGRMEVEVVGTASLLMDEEAVRSAAVAWSGTEIDALVIVQATFADSTLVVAAADTTPAPLVLWAAPEPRTGGRLRRNSFCGINLAAYTLKRSDRDYRYVHGDPADPDTEAALRQLLGSPPQPVRSARPDPPSPSHGPAAVAAASRIVERLSRSKIGIVGERPAGFEPCAFDAASAQATLGVALESVPLDELFDAGRRAAAGDVDGVSAQVAAQLDLEPLGGASIEPSVRLHLGLQDLIDDHGWSAVATRCWPECFTEFGGAACTAQSLLNSERGIPALCEADAYGAVTSLVLQSLASAPSFVADLVDLDTAADTAVVWHCGLAPTTMASDQPRAALHSNRRLPLLNEFALKAGVVTVGRISQSANQTRLVAGRGVMLEAPLPFSGTAGTLRFERPIPDVLDTIMTEGLEHHYGIVYGDHLEALTAVADHLDLDVVTL